MSSLSRILVFGTLVAFWSCQVEWGGGQISLENPAPPPDTTANAAEELEPEQLPLPDGPFLYAVRLDRSGNARLVPLAGIARDGDDLDLSDISIPDAEDPSFRARFDSVFLAPGSQLDLLARGARLGSLIVSGVSRTGVGGCPSVATGRALLVPGQDVPTFAFAVPGGVSETTGAARVPPVEPTNSMNVAGPVLAERLIGGDRAFLARRQSLSPFALAGDTLAGMAATWMIADSLAPGPPGKQAVSLFFMARFEPARGFITLWEEVRRYSDAEDKEAFEYLDWIQLGAQRLDVLRRYDASSVRLAVSISAEGEDRKISWMEPAGCSTLDRLSGN
ncbi:MAG: hypothetical protein ACC682_04810 [Gemmatimonadota bacterium]